MQTFETLELIKRLKALADTGLVFAKDPYDRDRYEELNAISLQLLASVADKPLEVIKDFFMPVSDYPTVKVDVRGFVLNDAHEILMTRESVDGKWTIPGGWADIGCSPSEAVVKEIEEETGFTAEAVQLLAVYDKKCHPHPPEPYYIYKLMFFCKITGGSLKAGFDMLGADFFSLDALPELSEDRILKSQLQQLYTKVLEADTKVYFD